MGSKEFLDCANFSQVVPIAVDVRSSDVDIEESIEGFFVQSLNLSSDANECSFKGVQHFVDVVVSEGVFALSSDRINEAQVRVLIVNILLVKGLCDIN